MHLVCIKNTWTRQSIARKAEPDEKSPAPGDNLFTRMARRGMSRSGTYRARESPYLTLMLGAERLCLGFCSQPGLGQTQTDQKSLFFPTNRALGLSTRVFPVWNAACFYKGTCDGRTEQGNKIPP
jgi:hypothetical protein